MPGERKPSRRRYDASGRQAAAAARRLAVVASAQRVFETHGWAGTRLQEISAGAGVSQKTVEAAFGTKAALLQAAVDYAIRGDTGATPVAQRAGVREMESATEAATFLRLHARHLRAINSRSARVAAVVEEAAPADAAVRKLWARMNRNRSYGVEWATATLLGKRGRRRGLTAERARPIFWVALDWGTYRTLTGLGGLDDDGYEEWLAAYYRRLLLP